MRHALLIPVLLASAPALADPLYNQPNGLGGGFIEFLATGQSPAPRPVAAPVMAPVPGTVVYSTPVNLPFDPLPRSAAPVRHAALPPEAYTVAPIRKAVDPRYMRQSVDYAGPHAPGTLVIDTPSRFLYLVQPGGRAIRYGIGVGRPGFEWAGVKSVTRKAEWPDWTPPPDMLRRRPDLPRYMAGGPDNPMGARALYLGSSLYRVHGTNEPHTIGQAVSSGCIRMMNDDVVDLYERTRVGTKVFVI